MRNERVPQEAFIGIVYASASALAILIISKSPHEGEQIKEMLVGKILLVRLPDVLKTAGIYAVIGLFHLLFRKRFFQISLDPEGAEREKVPVRWWDFLFYASFGVVITSSVAIAGVLLVFSYLVVPAACAVLLVEGIRARVLTAWGIGTLASLVGLKVSFVYDLPTGPSVVATFAGLLVCLGMTMHVLRAPRRGLALARVAAVIAVVALVTVGLLALGKKEEPEHPHEETFSANLALLESSDENLKIEAIHHLEGTKDPHALEKFVELASQAPADSQVLGHLIEAISKFAGVPRAAEGLVQVASRTDIDSQLRLEAGTGLLNLRDPRSIGVLVSLLDAPEEFVREKAARQLREATGKDLGYVPGGDPAKNRAAASAWHAFWEKGKDRLKWRENLKRFE
jgi:hypothetical protein